MKILVTNKFFFLNGGTEKYLQEFLPVFSSLGHTVIPFSVRYAGSWPSPYSHWFLPPPGKPEQVFFQSIQLNPQNILRYLGRSIYSFESRRYLNRLIREEGLPDIAYILNIYNYMSPSIIHSLRKYHIPIVMQLGDYNLLCPSYLFYHNGETCTQCLSGSYREAIHNRCVKGNLATTAVRVFGMTLHQWLKIYDQVDAFVVPCEFMKSMMTRGGYPKEKIHTFPYPTFLTDRITAETNRQYILFFGRIVAEKGVENLIRAYLELRNPPDLYIAGRSYDGEQERLEKIIPESAKGKIHFTGFLSGKKLDDIISGALLTVVPSTWYDNSPLCIYESFSLETPVLASRIGGIPEQIEDGITGKLFSPKSITELKFSLEWMLEDRDRLRKMGKAGKKFIQKNCSWKVHSNQLLKLFQETINQKRGNYLKTNDNSSIKKSNTLS